MSVCTVNDTVYCISWMWQGGLYCIEHCVLSWLDVAGCTVLYSILYCIGWMWLGVIYCTYFNTVYLMTLEGVFSVFALLKFIFPLIMIMSGMDMSWSQVNTGEFHGL